MSRRDEQSADVARRLREELDRIRGVERRLEEALEEVRQTRRRVEALVEPEEPGPASGPAGLPWRRSRERGWAAAPASAQVHPLPGSDGDPPEPEEDAPADLPADESNRPRTPLAVAAALVAVLLVAWLAFQGLRSAAASRGTLVLAGDRAPAAVEEPEEASPPTGEAPATEPERTPVLAVLPEGVEARVQLYDSLFRARSPLFAPLLDSLVAVGTADDVEEAVEAWRAGDPGAKERDVVQSALVQWILKREIDRTLDVDGELLRNPCRGSSCSALLNVWQVGRERFGFPEIPDDAPRNAAALHQVEALLVLERMRDLAG